MKKAHFGFATITSLVMAATVVTPGAATSPESSIEGEAAEGIQTISAVAPEVFTGMASGAEDAKADFPNTSAGQIELETKQGESINLELPFGANQAPEEQMSSTISAYDNANGSMTIPVAKEDGGVAVQTVIESSSAPDEYEYDFDLPAGASLEETDNGGVIILDADRQYLAALAAPWAKDANGADVPTDYEVDGNRVTQHVDLTSVVDFPVVADPYLGFDLINGDKSNWTGSGNSRTANIHVSPQMAVAWGAGTAHTNGWPEAIDKMGSELDQTTYLQQFKCHADNAPLVMAGGAYASTWDNVWNLEFSRGSNADFGNVVSHQCNW